MILVLCAVAAELSHFSPPRGVEIHACGVGPVEAAVTTTRLLSTMRYTCVVNAGIAGAFRGSATIGEAVIVTHETYADLGIEGRIPMTLPGGAQIVEEVAADADLHAALSALSYQRARGITVTQATATGLTAERLRHAYRADVESMEGFAVLRSAAVARVPAIEIRGISNYVGDRAAGEWNFAAGASAAVHALGAAVELLLLPTFSKDA